MATSRELVTHILQNNDELREWFETKHSFTIDKAKRGSLEDYGDLVSVIIREGVKCRIITEEQATGAAPL